GCSGRPGSRGTASAARRSRRSTRTSSRTPAALARRTRSLSWPRRAGARSSSSASSSATTSSSWASSTCRRSGRRRQTRGEPGRVAPPRRAQGDQLRARAAAPVVPRIGAGRIGRFLPSLRSVVVGVALLAVAIGGYAVLRASSAFAIRHIVVSGASPKVAAEVRRALAPFRGRSLLGLDAGELARRVDALPSVVSVGYDRNFPHTLRLTVVAERPVAVLHSGTRTWLLSARG